MTALAVVLSVAIVAGAALLAWRWWLSMRTAEGAVKMRNLDAEWERLHLIEDRLKKLEYGGLNKR